uniref:Uncharacterized protein n=1 Tax=Quercus lobata TaxID=97700 RepID=A0A7N2LGF7_QUELO
MVLQLYTNLAVMQNNENNLLQYVDFAKNIRKGDWNAAKDFLRLHLDSGGNMALKLLEQCPGLAIALDMRGESPVLALACISFAYPSGNQLIFWKQWIYHREYYSLFVLL